MNFLAGLLGRIVYWVIWPGTWLYLRWSTRTRLIISYRGEIMVVKQWLGDGKYNLPGGGLKSDESPAHGAVRELYEETGLTLHEAEVELLASEPYRHDGMSFKCHYFAYRAGSRPVTKAKFPEIIEVAWLGRQEIRRSTCSPEVIRALELLDAAPGRGGP